MTAGNQKREFQDTAALEKMQDKISTEVEETRKEKIEERRPAEEEAKRKKEAARREQEAKEAEENKRLRGLH